MLNNHVYYSTYSPNIQIKVNSNFTYDTDESGHLKHKFTNSRDCKLIFIEHYKYSGNKRKIAHWGPNTVFKGVSNKIDSGTLSILGKKWYYCDHIDISSEQCVLIRDIAIFTQDHEWLFVRYVKSLPSYDCDNWKNITVLTDEQRKFHRNFIDEFSRDIEMKNYNLRE